MVRRVDDLDPGVAMNGEEELILGSCNLPFEDDRSMVIVNMQYHSSNESEVITGDVGDFPILHDHDQDENGSRPVESPPNQIKVEKEEESSTTFIALETDSTCELAFPDPTCLPSAGQLDNASTLNPTEIFTNESSVTTFNNGSEKQRSPSPKELPFSCSNCSRKFIRKFNLDRHMDICNMGLPDIICLPITEQCNNSSTLNSNENTNSKTFVATDNKKRKHGSEKITQCSQQFNGENQKTSNPEGPQFSCDICSKKFARKYSRDCHVRNAVCKTKRIQHSTLKKYHFKQRCPFCLYQCRFSCHLRNHVITVHKKSITYICPICQKSIAVLEDLVERHFSDHVSNLECTSCELKFQSREKLDAHIETESSGKGHLKCLDCQSTFCKWIDLFTHIIEHLPAGDCRNPVACNICKLRLEFTKDFLNHLTGVGVDTSTHASDSDIELIDTKKKEYDIVLISDDDDDDGDHNAESNSDKTPVHSSGAHSPDLQSTVGPVFTLQSSGGQSSDVPSPMLQRTVLSIPRIFLLPAMGMASNIVSSAVPDLLPSVTSGTIVAQSAMTAATSTTASQPVSEEKLVSMECIKSDLIDDSFPDDQKENLQDGEDDSTPQLRLQNVYSLAGSVPTLECTENGIVSNNRSESSEAESGCLMHCRYCWQRLEDGELLRRHERDHTIRRLRYACPRCYRLYTKKGTVQKHFDAKRCSSVPSSTFTCKECGALFSYQTHLMEHYMTAHSQPSSVPPTCPICKIVLSQGHLDNHLEVVHKLRLESIGGGMTVLRDILPTNGT